MIFLVLSGKMIFLFPENIILFFRRKMKDDLSQKNTWKYDIFFKCSEKMVFPKKSHGNMIFLVVLSGKMIFLFPENMILFFRRKMKDDLSQKKKKYIEKWYFLEMPRKDGLSKKNGAWIWSFLYYLERLGFFFQKIYFSLDGKWKMIFFKKYMEVWYFLCICKNVTNMIFSRKIYLKVIDILDRILERVPIILCTFMETFRRFDILLSSEKNPGNLIYRI